MTDGTPAQLPRLTAFLEGDDPRLVKYAIQRICEALETNRDLKVRESAWSLLSRHQNSRHVIVRRWLYKLVGLSRERRFSPWLYQQLRGGETDPEALTWAVAAWFALEPFAPLDQRLRDFGLHGQPFDLAGRFFRASIEPLDKKRESLVLATDDKLPPMWLALLYGTKPHLVRKAVIQELTGHDEPLVTEYAVWSLVWSKRGNYTDTRIGPNQIARHDPQVRRWVYRLMGRDPANLHLYCDLLNERIKEEDDPRGREGLALALGETTPDASLAPVVADWFATEDDVLTRYALEKHMQKVAGQVPCYREALASLPPGLTFASLEDTAEIFERQPMRTSPVPAPRDVRIRESYVMVVDTVGFSKMPETRQYETWFDIRRACANNSAASEVDLNDCCYCNTGDGIIAAFSEPENRFVPLQLALAIATSAQQPDGKTLRIGVHAGPVHWIEMDNGGIELGGDAIIWATRVMEAADGGQVFLSDSYYHNHVRPCLDQLDVARCKLVRGKQTKHGEDLRIYELEP